MPDYIVRLEYEVLAEDATEAIEIARDYAEGDINVGGFNGLDFKAFQPNIA